MYFLRKQLLALPYSQWYNNRKSKKGDYYGQGTDQTG